jgi:hypothetical protein
MANPVSGFSRCKCLKTVATGAKAQHDFAALSARLKSCPVTVRIRLKHLIMYNAQGVETTTKTYAESLTTDLRVAADAPTATPAKGGILAVLLRSPLVGADLELTRPRIDMRKIDL